MGFVRTAAAWISVALSLTTVLSIAAWAEDHPRFFALPADKYPAHQTSEKVTIGISEYNTDEKQHEAFGKAKPYEVGILPVLVVIQNNTGSPLRLERLQASYLMADGEKIESTPAAELRYLRGAKKPSTTKIPSPIPGVPLGGSSKNPLAEWEIEGRAFAARVVSPGESASGFFYFQTGFSPRASLLVSGIENMQTHKELLFFEIPFSLPGKEDQPAH